MAPRANRAIGGRRWNWLHQAVRQSKSTTATRPAGGVIFTLALLTKLIIVAIKVAKITAVAVRVARTAATVVRAARALKAARHAVTFARRLKGAKKTGEILRKVKRVMDKAENAGDFLPDGAGDTASRERRSAVAVRGSKPKREAGLPPRVNSVTSLQMKKMRDLQARGKYMQLEAMRKRIQNKWASV